MCDRLVLSAIGTRESVVLLHYLLTPIRTPHQLLLTLFCKFLTLFPRESPRFPPYFRTRLTDCKRVEIVFVVQIRKRVIDESVCCFVGPYGADHV